MTLRQAAELDRQRGSSRRQLATQRTIVRNSRLMTLMMHRECASLLHPRSARRSSSASPALALVPLPHHPHRRQPDGVLRARGLQQLRAHAAKQSAASGHRDRAAARLPAPHLQDGDDVPRQPEARPVRYAQKKHAGPPSRKTFASSTMIVSGLWLLALPRHSRQGVQVRRRVRMAGGRPRSLPPRDGELRQPADGRLLRHQHGRRRLASLARRRRARSSRSASTSRAWTPRILPAGKVDRGRSSPAASSSSLLWAHFLTGRGHEARREDSGRPDRRRSGTGTSSR